MINEPGKVPNLNTVHYMVYVDRRKKLKDKRRRNVGFRFKLGDFPLETTKTSFCDGSVYEEHVQ